MKRRVLQFDGLRFYAITLIMASHSGAFHLLVGGTMVSLFFVLSGFFSARPFPGAQTTDFSKPLNWLLFYVRRAVRILPVFWLVSLVMFITGSFKGKEQGLDVFLKNVTLVEANGHFWYVQNQMAIYLLEPLIFLLITLIGQKLNEKWRNTICMIILIIAGILFEAILPGQPRLFLKGNGTGQYLRVGLFCIGAGFGMIARDLGKWRPDSPLEKLYLDFVELLLLFLGAFTAGYYLKKLGIVDRDILLGWKYPAPVALACGVLLLLLMINSEGLIAKFFSLRPIRAVGEASYSIFLVQSVLIRLLAISDPERKWLIASIASAGIGYMSYHLFEKPLSDTVDRALKRRVNARGKS